MPNTNRKKKSDVSTGLFRQKVAMDKLLESMDELAVSAAKRMTTDKVRQARKKINHLVDRAVDHKPRRETA